jgi:sugar phosphate permease
VGHYRTALGDWRLVAANVSYGLCQFVRYAMITWIPLYLLETTGDSIFKVSIKSTLFQLGGVVGSLLVGWMSDLKVFSSRRWAVVSIVMVLSAGAAVAVGFAPGAWVIVALALVGVGIESIEVAYFLIPSEFLGDEMTGTGVGCMNATGKLIASLQGVVLGTIIDIFGFGAAFGTAGVFALLAAALVVPSGLRRDQ